MTPYLPVCSGWKLASQSLGECTDQDFSVYVVLSNTSLSVNKLILVFASSMFSAITKASSMKKSVPIFINPFWNHLPSSSSFPQIPHRSAMTALTDVFHSHLFPASPSVRPLLYPPVTRLSPLSHVCQCICIHLFAFYLTILHLLHPSC